MHDFWATHFPSRNVEYLRYARLPLFSLAQRVIHPCQLSDWFLSKKTTHAHFRISICFPDISPHTCKAVPPPCGFFFFFWMFRLFQFLEVLVASRFKKPCSTPPPLGILSCDVYGDVTLDDLYYCTYIARKEYGNSTTTIVTRWKFVPAVKSSGALLNV